MSAFTLADPRTFPNGTVVKALPKSNWPTPGQPSGAPVGSATNEQTMTSDTLTFTGLTAGVEYWAVASVGGTYRYIGFIAGEDVSGPSISEAKAIALIEERGGGHAVQPFSKSGTLATETGTLRFRFPAAVTIDSVAITVGTAPTGASIKVDVNKNGTTIFTTQANRPTIAISGNASSDAVPDVTAVAAGDYLTFDIDQIGSTAPGADLVVVVRFH